MDDASIDVAVVSLSTPGVHTGDSVKARALARRWAISRVTTIDDNDHERQELLHTCLSSIQDARAATALFADDGFIELPTVNSRAHGTVDSAIRD